MWFQFPQEGGNKMLTGEFQHNIDTKGRMIIPVKFRDELGDSFIATKGLDKCLFIFPLLEWEKLDKQLANLSLSKGREIQRFFYGGMTHCEVDKQGRILIPANLREYADLEKDAVIIGLNKRAEVWSKNNWETQNGKFLQNTDEVAVQMEDLGI